MGDSVYLWSSIDNGEGSRGRLLEAADEALGVCGVCLTDDVCALGKGSDEKRFSQSTYAKV